MNKIKENNNKTNKKKILISILFLALTLFSILNPLIGSKSDNIKANALSAPTTKTLDLNGVRYEYQTSLNELKNKYNIFNRELTREFIVLREGESFVEVDFDLVDNSTFGEELAKQQEETLKNAINETIVVKDNNNNIVDKDTTTVLAKNTNGFYQINSIDFYGLNSLNYKFTFNLLNLTNRNFGGFSKNDIHNNYNASLSINFVFLNENYVSDDAEGLRENSIIKSYAFSKGIDFTVDVNEITPKDFRCRLIYITYADEDNNVDNGILSRVPNKYNNAHSSYTMDSYITIEDVQFIESNQTNIVSYITNYSTEQNNDEYPYFKGNLLLSETKYDVDLVKYLIAEFGGERNVPQGIGKGYFGGYDPTKNITSNIYYRYEFSGLQTGLRYIAVYDDLKTTSPFYSLYTGIPIGDKFWRYNNQNRLLYLENMNDLRMNNEAYTGAGLSAQIDDILYNVSLAGDVNQIEQNDDIKEDFINLLKTSALGTFIGLIIGLIAGAGPLGAVIGGSIGALIGIFPLIIDALQGLVGSSPALSTIYNLFKSVTMLFVDIFDAIINFALSFITNPIVLILVVVAVLVYIFVIRKFKK